MTRAPDKIMHILREPLLHFMVLGALVFAAHGMMRGELTAQDEIVVTPGRIENLVASFQRTNQRAPEMHELDQLIHNYIQEEILYREGVALGLETDDTVIRRRIAQKMQLYAESFITPAEPTEEELQAYLQEHRERFSADSKYSFSQEFIDPRRHGEDAEAVMDRLLASLRKDGSGAEGDPTLLEKTFSDAEIEEIRIQFGESFAQALEEMEPGRWEGPLESSFGLHAVRLDNVQPGRVPALSEVRDIVHREWTDKRRREDIQRYFEELGEKYTVRVESPPPEASL